MPHVSFQNDRVLLYDDVFPHRLVGFLTSLPHSKFERIHQIIATFRYKLTMNPITKQINELSHRILM